MYMYVFTMYMYISMKSHHGKNDQHDTQAKKSQHQHINQEPTAAFLTVFHMLVMFKNPFSLLKLGYDCTKFQVGIGGTMGSAGQSHSPPGGGEMAGELYDI